MIEMKHLPLGKLPMNTLKKCVLSHVIVDSSVLLPPRVGEDGTVLKLSDNLIIAAADPITGATEKAGWLSVHVNANDVAVHAAYPRWFLVTILLPEGANEPLIEDIMNGILKALREVDACLVGGHTEVTSRVVEPVIVGTMIGEPMIKGTYITSGGAEPGDAIILTKGAGIEGTLILATDFKERLQKEVGEDVLNRALMYERMISVLPDVKQIIKVGIENVTSMHDATEGGVLGAVYELAEASGRGFLIYEDKVIINPETRRICEVLKVDPLKLISSGSLIATVKKNKAKEAIALLRAAGIRAAVIGKILERPSERILVRRNGEEVSLKEPPLDELWRLYETNE